MVRRDGVERGEHGEPVGLVRYRVALGRRGRAGVIGGAAVLPGAGKPLASE